MRTCYRRELKKTFQSERSGAGADEIYTSNLWYFDEFEFLRDLEIPVPGKTTITSDDDDASTERLPSKVFKKSTNERNRTNERTEFLKRATEHLEASKNQQDDAGIYAEGRACMFRQMSPQQQLFAKQAVDEIMLLGRLNKLCLNHLHSDYERLTPSTSSVSGSSTPFMNSDSHNFVSVPLLSPVSPTPPVYQFTSQIPIANNTALQYASVHNLLNDTQYQ